MDENEVLQTAVCSANKNLIMSLISFWKSKSNMSDSLEESYNRKLQKLQSEIKLLEKALEEVVILN
eukprot:766817-Hanusia_phi.AAC.2